MESRRRQHAATLRRAVHRTHRYSFDARLRHEHPQPLSQAERRARAPAEQHQHDERRANNQCGGGRALTYRQLLQENADFRRLWTGQVVSEIGDWFNNIAVLALTIQLAGKGSEGQAVALYAIARHLPLFIFGPLAGVVVDRACRRRVMIAADLSRAILALGFLFANIAGNLSVIYMVGASLFAVSAFFNAAKRASIPNLVQGTNALLSANSLSASTTAATIAV